MPVASLPRIAVSALVLATLLAGCASGVPQPTVEPQASGPLVPLAELHLLDDPKSWVGETTAVLRETSITPVTDDPAQSLPATVTSHDLAGDVEVTVTDTSRILGLDLAGSISATIAGLGFGDHLVGRDSSSTFPGVVDLPLVTTGGHTINNESVIALRPTLIITDGTIGPIDVMLQLRDVGIPIVFVDAGTGFDGVYELTEQVAHALGADEAGRQLSERLRTEISAKVAEVAAIAPKEPGDRLRMLFLYLRGDSGIYYLFGAESGADDLIDAVGGIDVATEIGWSGMKPMTDEAIIAAAPDLILVMSSGLQSAGGVDGLLQTKAAIGITPAGQNRRFVTMADGEILSFGPRTADVIDAVARAVYAPTG
ncbi:heme/hemin ABC transporter substrate-binding protein [Homoserinimonas sp. A447]